jgi:hypothetical protein
MYAFAIVWLLKEFNSAIVLCDNVEICQQSVPMILKFLRVIKVITKQLNLLSELQRIDGASFKRLVNV